MRCANVDEGAADWILVTLLLNSNREKKEDRNELEAELVFIRVGRSNTREFKERNQFLKSQNLRAPLYIVESPVCLISRWEFHFWRSFVFLSAFL